MFALRESGFRIIARMNQEKVREVLTRERQWPWFGPGVVLILAGLFWAWQSTEPNVSAEDMKLDATRHRAASSLDRGLAVSNQIEQAKQSYDRSPNADSAASRVTLERYLIEASLQSLTKPESNSVLPRLPDMVSLAAKAQEARGKQSREWLDQAAIEVGNSLAENRRSLEEVEREQATAQSTKGRAR